MNNIKFRVWDMIGLTWMKIFEVNLLDESYLNNPEYIIQRFTGLKDKSEKEIYEGDIVQFYLSGSRRGVILWGADKQPFEEADRADIKRVEEVYMKENGSWSICDVRPTEGFKIIGNIFENLKLTS